ncbi:MAG: hypothetical protein ABIR28_02525 [Vicinamibacteria bacterium]
MKKHTLAAVLLAVFGFAGLATAHEGHAHKVMGKVTAVDDMRIEVEGRDGKKVSGLLGPKTMFMRGRIVAVLADVKVGQRVVVTMVEEHETMNVTKVMLGAKAVAHKTPVAKH